MAESALSKGLRKVVKDVDSLIANGVRDFMKIRQSWRELQALKGNAEKEDDPDKSSQDSV